MHIEHVHRYMHRYINSNASHICLTDEILIISLALTYSTTHDNNRLSDWHKLQSFLRIICFWEHWQQKVTEVISTHSLTHWNKNVLMCQCPDRGRNDIWNIHSFFPRLCRVNIKIIMQCQLTRGRLHSRWFRRRCGFHGYRFPDRHHRQEGCRWRMLGRHHGRLTETHLRHTRGRISRGHIFRPVDVTTCFTWPLSILTTLDVVTVTGRAWSGRPT